MKKRVYMGLTFGLAAMLPMSLYMGIWVAEKMSSLLYAPVPTIVITLGACFSLHRLENL